MNSGFESIYVVADGNGGRCLSEIQEKFSDTFYKNCGSIAITNSKVI